MSFVFAALLDVKRGDPVTSDTLCSCPSLTSSHNLTFQWPGAGIKAAPSYCWVAFLEHSRLLLPNTCGK